jgi:hypothetical protein
MSIFEAIMLICFGAAWPLSIYKSFKSRKNAGKSIGFLYVIIVGYLAGIVNKIIHNPSDPVLYLYILNALMVSADTVIYYRNKIIERNEKKRNSMLHSAKQIGKPYEY